MKKNNIYIWLMVILAVMIIPNVAAQSQDCALGEVYVAGAGCQMPQIEIQQKITGNGQVGVASSVTGGLEAIRIDNPFAAPGQPVLVELTVSNIGAQYPFNLIPLPPNQYGFVMTIDPVDEVLYKKADGTYGRYDLDSVEWGSWFGSDWFAKGWFYLRKGLADLQVSTSDDICKFVDVNDYFPSFAKKRFIFDNYKEEMDKRHGRINEDNFNEKITDADIKEFFPSVYEWECIRSLDRESFESELEANYCPDSLTMGCIGEYMKENIGKLKTSSFVILTDEVAEGQCEYDEGDGITYCGIGQDGICPPGTEGICNGKSSYTFDFVLLVPADAPALSRSEFEQLISENKIIGDFTTNAATGEQYNFGYTEQATCPADDFSGGCHTLNVRIQAFNQEGISQLFRQTLGGAVIGGGGGAVIGTVIPGAGTLAGGVIGAIGGAVVGLIKGIVTWGDYELMGAPIYEGQGIFYVVAPALKVAAQFTLWLAVIAGAGATLYFTRRRTGA